MGEKRTAILEGKILVIVCAYNEQDHIQKCLSSISKSINHSGAAENFQLVCIDNSSTDNTSNIAEHFNDANVRYEYIKIAHSPLCVSRNSYKFFNNFDFVAYIDGDGSVDICWAKYLLEIVSETKCSIVSGAVRALTHPGENNSLWEVFYDSHLDGSTYLIGANMVFSTQFLNSIDGFPEIFPSRGDESCLLLKAKLLGKDITIDHRPDLIAFNHFPFEYSGFFKERFFDGRRSAEMSKLWGSPLSIFLRVVLRLARVFISICAVALLPFDLILSLACILVLFAAIIFDKVDFVVKIFGKALSKSNSATTHGVFAVILGFYLFDLGYLRGLFAPNAVSKSSIFSTSKPRKLSSSSGP